MNGMQGRSGRMVRGVLALLGCAPAGNRQPLSVSVMNGQESGFSVTSTLISGARDAILVDGQLTLSDGARVADWIQQSGRRLTTVFITHGHPDHYFGLAPVLARFPDVEVIATPTVIEELRAHAPQSVAQWKPLYGDNLTDQPIFPKPFTADHLTLEGRRVELIALRPGESEHATTLWIPSIKTVIAGDAVFTGVHVWLAEANAERRDSWLRNLDSLKALGPTVVVGGHRAPGAVDSPAVLDSTAQYIRDFNQAVATSRRPEQVTAKMTAAHGTRTLPVILELAAKAAFSGGSK